jgi:ligand-binding SRPBCC domain-containing protein
MMTSRIKLLYRCEIAASTHKVWLWHLRRYCVDTLTPPNPHLIIEKRPVNLNKGSRLSLQLRLFQGFSFPLTFEHTGSVAFRQFTDSLIKGPCRYWKHEHRFLPWKESATVIEDHLEIELTRFGWLNRYLHPLLEKKLDRLFRWRHHTTGFNLKLWQEWPFADQVNVLGLSSKTHWLTARLQAQLEPIPTHDHDPHKLTTRYGLNATILNAIGYTKPILSHLALENLRKSQCSVLICFYDQKNPPWLSILEAYGDQVVYVQVSELVNPYQWIFRPSKQENWCSAEDLLSLVFQVLHERSGYGKWHYCRSEPLKNSFRGYFKKKIQDLKNEKQPHWIKKLLISMLEQLGRVIYPQNIHPRFNLKITPWKSFKHWKEISYRI